MINGGGVLALNTLGTTVSTVNSGGGVPVFSRDTINVHLSVKPHLSYSSFDNADAYSNSERLQGSPSHAGHPSSHSAASFFCRTGWCNILWLWAPLSGHYQASRRFDSGSGNRRAADKQTYQYPLLLAKWSPRERRNFHALHSDYRHDSGPVNKAYGRIIIL